MEKKAYLFEHKRPSGSSYLFVAFGTDIHEAREKAIKELDINWSDDLECINEDIWYVE